MQDRNYTLYMHTNMINDKKYIGVTGKDINNRYGNNGKNYSGQKFYDYIKKYGWDNFKHEVLLCNLTKDEATEMEVLVISHYKSKDPEFGYNVSKGGVCLTSHTDKTKAKISKTMSKLQMGENNTMYGKTPPNIRKVLCVETNTEYQSLKSAQENTGIQFKNIHKVCNGQRHTAGGYHWKYAD